MTSFRDARDFLTTALFNNVISEDEYIILYDLNSSKNLDLPYDEFMRFDVDEMEDSECVAELRVHKHGLPAPAEALQIPRVFRCRQRSISDGMEGLCTLLRRLAYPCRYSDMMARFGRPAPVLSMRTNEVLDFIYTNHSHRILQWNPAILQPVKLKEHANAIQIKGGALDNCFGVIDGTVRPISRPGRHQRIVYNGHKRLHALKFQSVNNLTQLWSRLNLLSSRVGKIGDSIEQLQRYSFQYNIKTIGLPESETQELASETASLSINLFKAAGIEISTQDIDIAHRIPTRIVTSGP